MQVRLYTLALMVSLLAIVVEGSRDARRTSTVGSKGARNGPVWRSPAGELEGLRRPAMDRSDPAGSPPTRPPGPFHRPRRRGTISSVNPPPRRSPRADAIRVAGEGGGD